jgi:hypothetical protein
MLAQQQGLPGDVRTQSMARKQLARHKNVSRRNVAGCKPSRGGPSRLKRQEGRGIMASSALRHPRVGEMVHYFTGDTELSSAPCHPAVITRVLDDKLVNLRVFFDMSDTAPVRGQAHLLNGDKFRAGWRYLPPA